MKTRVIYVNCKWTGLPIETVDEFPYNNKEERKEAHRCVNEYRLSDPSGNYYLSQRCTKEWKTK